MRLPALPPPEVRGRASSRWDRATVLSALERLEGRDDAEARRERSYLEGLLERE